MTTKKPKVEEELIKKFGLYKWFFCKTDISDDRKMIFFSSYKYRDSIKSVISRVEVGNVLVILSHSGPVLYFGEAM